MSIYRSPGAGFQRKAWRAAIAAVMIVATAIPLHAQTDGGGEEPAAEEKAVVITSATKDRADIAIDRAVRFLVSKQDAQEGFICDNATNRTAITSMAILAIAAVGHQPTDQTPEGRALVRAIRYILHPDRVEENGYFGNKDGSKMYGHGITTLAMSEMLGMSIDEETDALLRRRLTKAIALILKSQQVTKGFGNEGGWRYTPDSEDADTSVTVWMIMAMRSAKNAGIEVPDKAIEGALAYIKSCYLNFVDTPGTSFGISYTSKSVKYMSTSTTSMGLLSILLSGEFDSPVVRGASQYLIENPPIWGNVWLHYGTYYYAQAMFQLGPKQYAKSRQVVNQLLLPEQKPNGSWEGGSDKEKQVGSVFCTSLGILSLGVKNHFLPIYQR